MSDVGLCASMSAAMGTERISCERVTDVKGWIMIHCLFNVFPVIYSSIFYFNLLQETPIYFL